MRPLKRLLFLLYLQSCHGWFFPPLIEPSRALQEDPGIFSSILGGISSMLSRTMPQGPRLPGSEFNHEKLTQGGSILLEECQGGCFEVSGKPLTCGTLGLRRQGGRIVNGRPSGHSKNPWTVKVLYRDQSLCGASLISAAFLISAAHCFHGAQKQDFSLELCFGESLVNKQI